MSEMRLYNDAYQLNPNDPAALMANLTRPESVWRVEANWLPGHGEEEQLPLHANPNIADPAQYADAIVEAKDILMQLVYQGQQWHERQSNQRVWFEWTAEGSYPQRFLILGGELSITAGNSVNDPQLIPGKGVTSMLRLERSPNWHDPTPLNVLTDGIQQEVYAGPLGIPMFNPGTPAYVESLSIKGGTTAVSPVTGTLDSLPKITLDWGLTASLGDHETWLGIHPHGDYGRDDLEGFWQLTATGTAGSNVTEVTDTGDTFYRKLFTATNTLQTVCTNVSPMNDGGGDIRHAYGDHLILLRYRTDVDEVDEDEDEFGIVVSYGSGTTITLQQIFLPPSSNWKLVPVGILSLPSTLPRQHQNYGFNVRLSIKAQLLNTTGRTDSELEIDGFIPIPAYNHVYVQGVLGVVDNTIAHIEVMPNGELVAIEYDENTAFFRDMRPEGDIRVPLKGGKLIVASNSQSAGNIPAYQGKVSVQSYDSWQTWRGRNV